MLIAIDRSIAKAAGVNHVKSERKRDMNETETAAADRSDLAPSKQKLLCDSAHQSGKK